MRGYNGAVSLKSYPISGYQARALVEERAETVSGIKTAAAKAKLSCLIN
jgi:hypothetical protein